VRYKNFIIVMFKGHFELEGVIVATAFFLHRVFVVGDVISIAVPANPSPPHFFCRVEQRFLPLIVRAVGFD
jgi:hypothetical protein